MKSKPNIKKQAKAYFNHLLLKGLVKKVYIVDEQRNKCVELLATPKAFSIFAKTGAPDAPVSRTNLCHYNVRGEKYVGAWHPHLGKAVFAACDEEMSKVFGV